MHLSIETIRGWERFYRANFLNSLSGYKATHLVATADSARNPNLSLFHNIVHLGADPALIGLVNRPREAAPHTLANVEATGWLTLNSVHPAILAQAHQCSAKYPAGVSEFEATGLTPVWHEDVWPPTVGESRISCLLKLEEILPIARNNTWFIIGSVQQVWVPESLVQPDGFLQLEEAECVCSTGLDAYYLPQALARYRYAKPGEAPQRLA